MSVRCSCYRSTSSFQLLALTKEEDEKNELRDQMRVRGVRRTLLVNRKRFTNETPKKSMYFIENGKRANQPNQHLGFNYFLFFRIVILWN